MISASKTAALAGLAFAMSVPAFAQEAPATSSPITCATFLTLDSTGMAEAIVAARETASTSATTDGMATTDPAEATDAPAATTDGVAASDPATGTGTDNATTADTATDGATGGDEATAQATTDGVASSEPSAAPADGAMAKPDAEMSTEDLVAKAMTACATQPDMMISDVITTTP